MFAQMAKFQATLKQDPPVPMGSLDPYVPPTAGASNPSIEFPVPPPQY